MQTYIDYLKGLVMKILELYGPTKLEDLTKRVLRRDTEKRVQAEDATNHVKYVTERFNDEIEEKNGKYSLK